MTLTTFGLWAGLVASVSTILAFAIASFAFYYQIRQYIADRGKARKEFQRRR